VPVKQVVLEPEPTVEAPVPHEALVESFDVNEEPVEIMEGDSNQMQISLPEEKPTDSFEGWEDIMELVKQRNRTLGSFLAKSVAHFDGTHVLIEGSDMAMAFIRDNKDSNQILKDAIFEITGKRYPIGPWKKKETVVEENSDMQNLIELARANGIDIERK